MNKFIDLATQRLRNKLSGEKAFYELEDLEAAGFPPTVLDALQQELVNQLHEDLEMPLTEWASLDREPVKQAWNQFMNAAEEQLRLPEYKVNALLKSVVNKLYPLLVWPRTQIPKFIFKDRDELDRHEVADRVEQLPVNQPLGSAVMRYMNKKNVDHLSQQKCKDVVKKIDEKLTERYTHEKWFESARPLFELADGSVPTDLLASYFFHRGKRGWSNKLAQMTGEISESKFQEWIHKAQQEASSSAANRPEAEPRSVANVREEKVPEQEESNINARFESRDRKTEERNESPESSTPQSVNRSASVDKEDSRSDSETTSSSYSDSEEDEPIWRKFFAGEEDRSEADAEEQTIKEQQAPSRTPAEDAEGYQLNELFKEDNGELDHEEAQELNRYLKGQREYFIREIFRGSLSAYEQAVRKLSTCKGWEEAYPYIDREIFDRNNIDLYSQPALDFTDTMQSYFQDLKSSGDMKNM